MGKFKHAVKEAIPAVLTVIGSAATVGGIILAAKEGPKFKEETEGKDLTIWQKIRIGAKIFAPAIGCGVLSVSCGVGAHMMDKKTQASLVGACAAINNGYKKFKEKNAELNGEEANEKVLEAIEEDKIKEKKEEDLPEATKPIVVHLKNLCDDIPELTFVSTRYTILSAVVRINRMIDLLESATVNDFLGLLERDPISGGSDIGWSCDMLWNYYRTTYLNFDFEEEDDGTITFYPNVSANGGYLLDMGLIE